jgi:hypothetical protein
LDTLPDCPIVLTSVDGPSLGSLPGSKVLCLRVQDDAATLTVHAYDANGARSSTVLEDETLRADFSLVDNWEQYARNFSLNGDWIALTTVNQDVLIDLRDSAPRYQSLPKLVDGFTARGFSPSGRYLFQQRGQFLDLEILPQDAEREPIAYPLSNGAHELSACDTARHMAGWCGAPAAAADADARWAPNADIGASLSAFEGLSVMSFSEEEVAVFSIPVSTCGSDCVTQYAFGPQSAAAQKEE